MARFVGDPTDQDSLNVAMLSFQFLSAICAVYASIVACVGFACAKRDDVGEKERRLPRVMIAWIVFACFGMVLLIGSSISEDLFLFTYPNSSKPRTLFVCLIFMTMSILMPLVLCNG